MARLCSASQEVEFRSGDVVTSAVLLGGALQALFGKRI